MTYVKYYKLSLDLYSSWVNEIIFINIKSNCYCKYDQKTSKSNYRNGNSKKTVKTSQGNVELDIPRGRQGSFEPIVEEKHTRDILESINDIYGIEVSASMISKITDKILPKALEWQNRALHKVYPIVFIDCVHFNVKSDNMVAKKAAYVVLGVTEEGYKEVLGIWI